MKNIKNYQPTPFTITDLHSFPVTKLKGKYSHWFFKDIQHSSTVASEVIIQEFLRLILPRHPKTRCLFDENYMQGKDPRGLLSKEAEGITSLGRINPIILAKKLMLGEITGLGEIAGMMLYIVECDSKLAGNVLVNASNQIIKIDGNQSNLSILRSELNVRFPLTAQGIKNLPSSPAYIRKHGCNWLGELNNGDNNFYSLLWQLLSFNKDFQLELNSILFKILLVPDCIISQFIHSSIFNFMDIAFKDGVAKQFSARKQLLREQVFTLPAFANYVIKQGDKSYSTFLEQLMNFEFSKGFGPKNMSDDFVAEIEQELNLLKSLANSRTNTSISTAHGVIILILLAAVASILIHYQCDKSSIFRNTPH